ncbi:MAG: hypothetical protein HQK87_05605, partial [Nitrospinae bacterium]|nr:hypothetical protein [Nitrospinota bacterium]
TIRGEGAPAAELAEGFDRVMEGKRPPARKPTLPDTSRPVVALDSRPTLGVYPVKRMYMGRIKKARRRIWIAQAYFLPRHRFRKALARAVGRGVDVRVIIPDRSDVRAADLAAWAPVGKLMSHGVKVARYAAGMLHTKMALIDDTLIVGAANLDSMSLYWNRELALMIREPSVVAAAERLFADYETKALPTTAAMVGSRPWGERFAGWLLRPFLWIL